MSNIASEGVTALVTFTLAALLRPEQFGLVGMAYLFIVFIELVLGFGFSTTLIQRHDLLDEHLTSVFWFNLLTGTVLCGLAILLSGWWASANHAPDLQAVIIALSSLVPVQGLCIVHTALLQRQLDFKHLAVRSVFGTAAGGVTGIGLALAGFGVWALVGQHLVRESASAVLLWRFSSWRPTLSFKFSAISSLSGYSWRVFAGQIGVFFQNQTESLMMGLFFGPLAVGFYRFADRLVEMTLKFFPRAIQVVSLVAFSRLQRHDHELKQHFVRSCYLICFATVPVLAFMVSTADSIMGAVGRDWLPAAPVLRILTFVGLSKAITLLVGSLLQSVSRPGTHSFNVWAFGLVNAAGLAAVCRFVGDMPAGKQVVAVAATRAVVYWLGFTPLLLVQARRATGISPRSLLSRVLPPLLCGGMLAGGLLILQPILTALLPGRAFAGLALSAVVAACVWVLGTHLLDQEGYALMKQSFCRIRLMIRPVSRKTVVS